MDSRPLLKADKIKVFLDSNTFQDLAENDERVYTAILRHNGSEVMEFVRNPIETQLDELNNVVTYKFEISETPQVNAVIIKREKSEEQIAFWYKKDDILSTAKTVYGKEQISEEEFDRILLVFIQATFIGTGKSNVFITNDRLILKKRLWFESHFPGCALNIMSIKEASIFLDLFLKRKEKYVASHNYYLNKGYWYLLSMRLKLPHFNVGDEMIDALSTRFVYSLMALDEMGMQYYDGVNNDTMDNTLYHFNYLISLFTGIFDNLALETDEKLGISFPDKCRISLNNKSGRYFLKKIRDVNPIIREHINSYVEFISLIYLFREKVIHQENLPKTAFENRSNEGVWYANFVKINEEILQKLKACGDTNSEHDPFTIWGSYQIYGDRYLDPYNFSMAAMSKLIEFTDKYLELLGYLSFIEKQKKKNDDFTKTLVFFEKYHLGF